MLCPGLGQQELGNESQHMIPTGSCPWQKIPQEGWRAALQAGQCLTGAARHYLPTNHCPGVSAAQHITHDQGNSGLSLGACLLPQTRLSESPAIQTALSKACLLFPSLPPEIFHIFLVFPARRALIPPLSPWGCHSHWQLCGDRGRFSGHSFCPP